MEPKRSLALEEIDLSDPLFWLRPTDEREGAFLTLREEDPIRFFAEPDPGRDDAGRSRLLLADPACRRARRQQALGHVLLG